MLQNKVQHTIQDRMYDLNHLASTAKSVTQTIIKSTDSIESGEKQLKMMSREVNSENTRDTLRRANLECDIASLDTIEVCLNAPLFGVFYVLIDNHIVFQEFFREFSMKEKSGAAVDNLQVAVGKPFFH